MAATSQSLTETPVGGAFWRGVGRRVRSLWQDRSFREKRAFYRGVYLFHGFSRVALSLLVRRLVEKTYGDGESIFQEGDVGRACFVVMEGRVRLSSGGHEIAVLEKGDFFGEMALLDELPRSAAALAAGPCRLAVLYKTHFDRLLAEDPRAASRLLHALARLLSARLRQRAGAAAPAS